MRVLLKVIGFIVLGLALVVGAGMAFLYVGFPKREKASAAKFEATPARIERGEYLANHVIPCFHCHSMPDTSYYACPVRPDTKGKGGASVREKGLGEIHIPNITPANLASWTDGEIARAITSGVDKEGNPLFPMMPYPDYRNMPEEDVQAIVAYLRTIPAIPNEVPRSQLAFPLRLIARTFPKPYKPKPAVARQDTVAYGGYLAEISGCAFCHTQHDSRGKPLAGLEFAGGEEIPIGVSPTGEPTSSAHSANLTPDEETGIGAWDKEFFISRFKDYGDSSASWVRVGEGESNTAMPWTMFAGMTEDDLGAIYTYLRSLAPVKNEVSKPARPSISR